MYRLRVDDPRNSRVADLRGSPVRRPGPVGGGLMGRRDKIALGLTLVAVIVIPGLANAALSSIGYGTLGSIVWAVGYGSGALFVWYVYIRPLDISAPEGVDTEEE